MNDHDKTRYQYQGDSDPATDFMLIDGPDGMVSYETVLNLLNGIENLKRPDLSITAVYRLEHVNRFVVESGGKEVVLHDLIEAMNEAMKEGAQ